MKYKKQSNILREVLEINMDERQDQYINLSDIEEADQINIILTQDNNNNNYNTSNTTNINNINNNIHNSSINYYNNNNNNNSNNNNNDSNNQFS